MNWLLSIALHNIVGTAQALVQRKIGKTYKNSASAVSLIAFSGLAIFSIIIGLLSINSIEFSVASGYFYLFIIGATAFALQKIFVQKLYEKLHAGSATILTTLNIAVAVTLSTFLLNEGLESIQYLGLFLLMISIVISMRNEASIIKNFSVKSSVGLAFLASFLFGIGFVSERYLLSKLNVVTYIFFGWLLQALVVVLVCRFNKVSMPKTPRFKRLAILYAILFVLSGLFFVLSLSGTENASLVASLSNIKVIAIAILAVGIVGDSRKTTNTILVSFLTVIAVFLLLSP